VTTTATLDGTLAVTADSRIDFYLGAAMDVLVAGAVSGTFATIVAPASIEITVLSDRVRARVVGGPPVDDYNLDLGQPDFGAPPFAPSNLYAGAAGQPGLWQSLGSFIGTSPSPLYDVNARDNGMTMLEIPANYYDDLDARFDLPAELLCRLRENQVLYDRDTNGEYFQIYTQNFAGWLFFEVVERRNYNGFGAVNAPIRLAAQTRIAPKKFMPRIA